MNELIDTGRALGLEGVELRQFVAEQQELVRAKRAAQREAEAAERVAQREAAERAVEREREREFELERARLMAMAGDAQSNANAIGVGAAGGGSTAIKGPKMPCFADGKDRLDSYLMRFERYARDCGRSRDTHGLVP